MIFENSSGFSLSVSLNIRCSRRCDNPVVPSFSLREPTRYQTCTVTTGALVIGSTRTLRPFSSVASRTLSVSNAEPAAAPFEAISISVTTKTPNQRRRRDIGSRGKQFTHHDTRWVLGHSAVGELDSHLGPAHFLTQPFMVRMGERRLGER